MQLHQLVAALYARFYKTRKKKKYMFRTTLQEATDALTSAYNAFNWVAQNPEVVPILVLFKIRVQLPRCPRRIPLHLNPVAVLAGPRLP